MAPRQQSPPHVLRTLTSGKTDINGNQDHSYRRSSSVSEYEGQVFRFPDPQRP
jgi:hypothetical protein